ncbi:hypothetical protein, partial [Sulfitobacter mediterraneus]|uniref:hypothetical protein n=1 Tax=Sulfitobacter mediterraneus TaxID=83219 RepID=UPI001E5D5E1F
RNDTDPETESSIDSTFGPQQKWGDYRTIDTCVTWLRVIRSTSRSFGLLRYSSMYLISLNVVWIVVALTPDLALWLVQDR